MTYNGHKNYDYWNVSLWIGNDEGIYNLARDLKREHKTVREAAHAFVDTMKDIGHTHTPDGVKYTQNAVEAAMRDL